MNYKLISGICKRAAEEKEKGFINRAANATGSAALDLAALAGGGLAGGTLGNVGGELLGRRANPAMYQRGVAEDAGWGNTYQQLSDEATQNYRGLGTAAGIGLGIAGGALINKLRKSRPAVNLPAYGKQAAEERVKTTRPLTERVSLGMDNAATALAMGGAGGYAGWQGGKALSNMRGVKARLGDLNAKAPGAVLGAGAGLLGASLINNLRSIESHTRIPNYAADPNYRKQAAEEELTPAPAPAPAPALKKQPVGPYQRAVTYGGLLGGTAGGTGGYLLANKALSALYGKAGPTGYQAPVLRGTLGSLGAVSGAAAGASAATLATLLGRTVAPVVVPGYRNNKY